MLIEFAGHYFYWDEEKAKHAFYEADDRRHKLIRWTVVLLLIAVGVGILAGNLDDLRAHELAAREPIQVEATISVKEEGWWNDLYMMYLSYSYDGVDYEGVRYYGNQNPATPYREGETVIVALDPRDHGQLAEKILKTGRINWAIGMLSLGLGLAAYFLALRSETFYRKREEKAAQHSGDRGRPDYILDTAIFTGPILVLVLLGFSLAFPTAFGIAPWVAVGLMAMLFLALRVTLKTFRK